ncbi:MAG: DUF488 domain-containing protein [Planctomycetota bacterium]
MQLYTIGFAGKSAEQFFSLLHAARVERLIDVRRSNNTLYCGFTRARDLPFFLARLGPVEYVQESEFAPSLELLRAYQARLKKSRKDPEAWPEYVERFTKELAERPVVELFRRHTAGVSRVALLCTEPKAEHCHRSLLAEHIQAREAAVEVIHL